MASANTSSNKLNKNEDLSKTGDHKKPDNIKIEAHKSASDTTQISDTATKLLALKMEANKYLNKVKDSKSISQAEIDEIKDKIREKYYSDEDVVDKIVDNLAKLPNYVRKKY
ncbi:MAG: hypothetical protein P8X42_04265 [Calditrichaceae bacterium]